MDVANLSYYLDAQDVIVAVNEAYNRFGVANQARLTDTEVLGKSVWNFVKGDDLPGFLKAFLNRARLKPARLPYRCDAPGQLRLWELEARPEGELLLVTFREIEHRPRRSPGGKLRHLSRPVSLCSWCNGIIEGGRLRWPGPEEAEQLASTLLLTPSVVNHGLCSLCYESFKQPDLENRFEHLKILEVCSHPIIHLVPRKARAKLPLAAEQ